MILYKNLFIGIFCIVFIHALQAEQKSVQVVIHSRAVQLLPSSPVFVAGVGNVTTYYSTFNGTAGLPLIDTSNGGVVSGELRPRLNSNGIYEGSYGQVTDLFVIDYGSYAITIPSTDADGNVIPDVLQIDRPGSFDAFGSGYSAAAGLTFSISINFARSVNSGVGTYKATTQNSAGQISSVTGTYSVLSYRGSASYQRGAINTLSLSLQNSADSSRAISGSTTFTTVNQDEMTYAAFEANGTDGRIYHVKAGKLTRSGGLYRGSLELVDGLPETFWADFTGYAFVLTDPNDSNQNGVPDLTDPSALAISFQSSPQNQSPGMGGTVMLSAAASGAALFQWQRNGSEIAGAQSPSLVLANIQPSQAGLYSVRAANGVGSIDSRPAIVGLASATKVEGLAEEIGPDILHPNGNTFDQVLLQGESAVVTSDYLSNQTTRISFIDADDDIVQVEFSGPGALALVLDAASPAAPPLNYNQVIAYPKGHAGIVITGADERTNVSIFTVGRATAFDPTGAYNILESPSSSNDPKKNGSSLFLGHTTTNYDGIADLAFIAISSSDGKFGGIRAANATFSAFQGWTGIYAPSVSFQGPIYFGDISAFDKAVPIIAIGAASDVRVTGGSLLQANGRPIQVEGLNAVTFRDGSDSHGNLIPAKANQVIFEQDGVNITGQIVRAQ
jgi:hypothetical protein